MMKRFVAGAICPKCQLIDKIVVYHNGETEVCECVRCGYKQFQAQEAKPVIAKLGKKEHIIKVMRSQTRIDNNP